LTINLLFAEELLSRAEAALIAADLRSWLAGERDRAPGLFTAA
jgi:hypothetical protein